MANKLAALTGRRVLHKYKVCRLEIALTLTRASRALVAHLCRSLVPRVRLEMPTSKLKDLHSAVLITVPPPHCATSLLCHLPIIPPPHYSTSLLCHLPSPHCATSSLNCTYYCMKQYDPCWIDIFHSSQKGSCYLIILPNYLNNVAA